MMWIKGRQLDIKDGNLDTTTALVYDAVHIFALALHELNMIQNINIGPIDCSGMILCSHRIQQPIPKLQIRILTNKIVLTM